MKMDGGTYVGTTTHSITDFYGVDAFITFVPETINGEIVTVTYHGMELPTEKKASEISLGTPRKKEPKNDGMSVGGEGGSNRLEDAIWKNLECLLVDNYLARQATRNIGGRLGMFVNRIKNEYVSKFGTALLFEEVHCDDVEGVTDVLFGKRG